MSEVIKLIEQEAVTTIEGLTGSAPEIKFTSSNDAALASIDGALAVAYFDVEGDASGQILLSLPVGVATALADMMVAGPGDAKDDMDEDDLDATKEILSNVLGTVSTTLSTNDSVPSMKFSVTDITFAQSADDVSISNFDKVFSFDFSIGEQSGQMLLITEDNMTGYFDGTAGGPQAAQSAPAAAPSGGGGGGGPSGGGSGLDLNDAEMNNMELLLDVKLPIKVRIGTKYMLLKDVINMDIGSVIELDRLVNDPLDILVDDKVVGRGEVVIVDGNFGIQITEVVHPKERLAALR
jgi:flagellar motor switch protein FliN/FliY